VVSPARPSSALTGFRRLLPVLPRPGSRARLAEALRRDIQRRVELARHVLKRDQGRQLDERVVIEVLLAARHQLVGDRQVRPRDRLGVVERDALALAEQSAATPAPERPQLVLANAALQQRSPS
jgi:hypothetical protein